jgi:lysophospholipase L1-like esterase
VNASTGQPEQPARIAWWWIAVPVGFTLATMLVLDMVGSAAIRELGVRNAARALLEAEVQQEPYRGTSWGRRYWEAIARYQEVWEPYYVYRVGSMVTEFINVSNGVRATYRMQPRGSEPHSVVFLFGGSAAWGHGARDEGTIASWLAKVAEDHGEPLDVRNYAESGWVNWQGISYLTQRLAEGERPDTVIFYSGVNEILSGRQWPQVRRPIWDAEAVPRAMTDWALERNRPLARVWHYYRNTSYLWSWLVPRPPVLPSAPTIARPELAARLADEYIADRVLVEHLGQVYGFKTLFVWQLSVADKPTLTAQERRYAGWLPRTTDTTPAIDWWAMDTELKHLYGEVGRLVKARGVFDIASALENATASAFIDWMHTSEAGNEQVARALYDIVQTPAPAR